jgi:hypothetical protein
MSEICKYVWPDASFPAGLKKYHPDKQNVWEDKHWK